MTLGKRCQKRTTRARTRVSKPNEARLLAGEKLGVRIRETAKRLGIQPKPTHHAAWAAVLARTAAQGDVVFGTIRTDSPTDVGLPSSVVPCRTNVAESAEGAVRRADTFLAAVERCAAVPSSRLSDSSELRELWPAFSCVLDCRTNGHRIQPALSANIQ